MVRVGKGEAQREQKGESEKILAQRDRLGHQVKAQFPVGVGWLVKSKPKVRAIDELHHPDFFYPGSVWVIQGETQDESGIFFDPVPAQGGEPCAMHGDIFNPAIYGFFGQGEVGNIMPIAEHMVGSLKVGGFSVKLSVLEPHWKNSGATASDPDHWREGCLLYTSPSPRD